MNNGYAQLHQEDTVPVNPLVKKLWSVDTYSENTATYGGVYRKCLFFLGMTALGALLAVFFAAAGYIYVNPMTDELSVDRLVVLLLLIGMGVFLVFPFLSFLLRITIPVTGSIYCASVGFLFGFVALLDAELGSYVVLALVLTLAVVAVMGFLFAKGIIRVNHKLRAVTSVAFFAMVTGSLLLFVCYFVPFLRECVMQLTNNPLLSIGGAVVGVIVAVLFLLVDFDNVREIVEDQLPKKYEWYAAFSLVFTVVWVYLKILQLIMKIKDRAS